MRRRLVQFVLSVFSTLLHHVQGRDELRSALPKAGAAPRAPMFDDAVIGELPYKGLGKTNKGYETSKPPPFLLLPGLGPGQRYCGAFFASCRA